MPENKSPSSLATVAEVLDASTVVINRGSNDGVHPGARFVVYCLGGEITDPETGESLGALEIVRGIGVVDHVQQRMATLVSTKTQKPRPTTKVIKRGSRAPGFGLWGPSEEVVEERQGEDIPLPFDAVEVGDKARLL